MALEYAINHMPYPQHCAPVSEEDLEKARERLRDQEYEKLREDGSTTLTDAELDAL
jgi:hypothetical protein